MFWNRRWVRIGVGAALLILGLMVVLPRLTGYTSLDGTVNARFVIVAAPIEGTVQNTAPKSGTTLQQGEHLLTIRNERVNRFVLTELSAELQSTRERLRALRSQESELRSMRTGLEARLDEFRNAMIANLDRQIEIQRERIGITEAQIAERQRDLVRKEKLGTTGHVPESELERSRTSVHMAEHELDAAKFELDRIGRRREAAQRNIFIEEGRNDVPYSQQRVDEIAITLLDIASRRAEQEAREIKLQRQIADEAARVKSLNLAEIRADFTGVMWRNSVVEGSTILVGNEMMRILDCRDLFVDILVHEVDYDDIYPYRDAEVRLFGRDTVVPGRVLSIRGSRADIEDKVLAATEPRSGDGQYARIRVQLAQSDLNDDFQHFCQVGRTAQVRFRTRSLPVARWLRSLWFSIS